MSYKVKTINLNRILPVLKNFGKLLNISECLNISTSEDVVNCLSKTYSIVEKLFKTDELIDDYSCIEKCLDIVKEVRKSLEILDECGQLIVKSYTSFGDSKFKQGEPPNEVKRIARYVEVSKELAVINLVKFGFAKTSISKLLKCMIKNCGVEKTTKLVDELCEIIQRNQVKNEYVDYVISKLRELKTEIKKH